MTLHAFILLLGSWLMLQTGDEIKVEPGKQLPQVAAIAPSGDDPNGGKESIRYMLFTPKDYKPEGEPWPLLLFLHGYGECSDSDLNRVKIHGPPKIVESRPDFPFVVVSPQCPSFERDMDKIIAAWQPDPLMRLVDHVAAKLNIDPERIYVTGLSMGGYGTWRLAAAYPERFAAAVPICGGGDPQKIAAKLRDVPIWAFHGAKDLTVPLSESQEMVDAVRAAGGDVRFTVYPDVAHDSWVAAYDDPAVYDWLLSHRRRDDGKTKSQ
jgi:predicted peptidase